MWPSANVLSCKRPFCEKACIQIKVADKIKSESSIGILCNGIDASISKCVCVLSHALLNNFVLMFWYKCLTLLFLYTVGTI